jgi:hypothetical protein
MYKKEWNYLRVKWAVFYQKNKFYLTGIIQANFWFNFVNHFVKKYRKKKFINLLWTQNLNSRRKPVLIYFSTSPNISPQSEDNITMSGANPKAKKVSKAKSNNTTNNTEKKKSEYRDFFYDHFLKQTKHPCTILTTQSRESTWVQVPYILALCPHEGKQVCLRSYRSKKC